MKRSLTVIFAGAFVAVVFIVLLATGRLYGNRVAIDTSVGAIVVELNPDKAPLTVANFIAYVDDGFYNGTIFHRVIKNFMVQGGGFNEAFEQKTTAAPVNNESDNGLKNVRGAIAMARTQDVHSATAQFFINTKDNGFLDYREGRYGYTVFGQVVAGYDVVEKIEAVTTASKHGHRDVPIENIVMTHVRRLYLWQ